MKAFTDCAYCGGEIRGHFAMIEGPDDQPGLAACIHEECADESARKFGELRCRLHYFRPCPPQARKMIDDANRRGDEKELH